MSDEVINIEESEAEAVAPHDVPDSLYIRMQPSPKAERIRQDSRVSFKGVLYVVSSKAQSGDGGGGRVEFDILKVNKTTEVVSPINPRCETQL
jgi:hypothetical protein